VDAVDQAARLTGISITSTLFWNLTAQRARATGFDLIGAVAVRRAKVQASKRGGPRG
jgi:hypothetical protein